MWSKSTLASPSASRGTTLRLERPMVPTDAGPLTAMRSASRRPTWPWSPLKNTPWLPWKIPGAVTSTSGKLSALTSINVVSTSSRECSGL